MEGDVGGYWRSLYKLEKSLSEVPRALHIATSVKTKVEDFKEHIPMVQVKGPSQSILPLLKVVRASCHLEKSF